MIKAAGGCIIAKDTKRILLQQRAASGSYARHWGFWGGKVEEDENVSQALLRELREEIDLDIIFWDYKIFNSQELSIPHPRASERDFVLFPMQDIVPNFRDPISKLTVKELIVRLKNYYIFQKLSYRNLL